MARAREIHVLDYILDHEGDKFRRRGNSYRMKEHPSFAITDAGFYWHSQKWGSVSALDYLVEVRKIDFVNAVCQLISEAPFEKGKKASRQRQERSPPVPPPSMSENDISIKETPSRLEQNLIIPRRNKDNYNAIAYLQNRGIDHDLIMDCIKRGVLYESALYHNVVFLGKDEKGKTRYAAIRSINGNFKCDAEGSSKKYGFVLPPSNPNSRKMAVFEAPINSMSHYTMCKRGDIPGFDGWRLSLGGLCIDAIKYFLEQHPDINHCLICTDNDKAGILVAEAIESGIGIETKRFMLAPGVDWNNKLTSILKGERLQGNDFFMNER